MLSIHRILRATGIAAVICFSLALNSEAAKKPAKMKPAPMVPPGKPEIFEVSPRGVQRGITNFVTLRGTNLSDVGALLLGDPRIIARILPSNSPSNQLRLELFPAPGLARGAYSISVKNTNATSSSLQLYVDDLPQIYEPAGKKTRTPAVYALPFSYWGLLNPPTDKDEIRFNGRQGETVVFDVAAKSIGSKANVNVTLSDAGGALLFSDNGFEGGDPLFAFKLPRAGQYRLRISDRTEGGSAEHFYRISAGPFGVVTGCFPQDVAANRTSVVQLCGLNLPRGSSATLHAASPGELAVPINLEMFRVRGEVKVRAHEGAELVENEPNNSPAQAMLLPVPSSVNGRIFREAQDHSAGADEDYFQFDAKKDQTLVLETEASRRGSPLDTRLEVLRANGTAVDQILLQAVRDSHLTFRGIDSVTDDLRVENWQEMELNQYLYLQGEVCRIFRMPQGPDSGFQLYSTGGKRRAYFNTSAITHALDEPLYIVEPHPPGTVLAPNGLPVFHLPYANDDDPDRKGGYDSRILFQPPADGRYVVRVSDTRAKQGEHFDYRLTVRPARPDFKVTLNGANLALLPGAGKEFSVAANRIDGFDGDIRVDLEGLPEGVVASTPLVIQAGHLEAKGILAANVDAKASVITNASPTRVKATATIAGQPVIHEVNNLGKLTLAPAPKLLVALEPYQESETNFVERAVSDKPVELTVAPGQSIPAWLKVKRHGHTDLVTFTVESLPHGVIVDNIGLNGVLIPAGENARRIFLTAASWVPEVDRFCFAQAKQAEIPTSFPVLIHVRKSAAQAAR